MFIKVFQKNTNGEIKNVICNSAKQGLIPQREYFDKDIANSDNTSGYYIIKNNDFVYNPRKSSDAPYGPVSRYKYSENGIVSPLYLCFRARMNLLSEYFDFYFKSPAWHRYIYMCGDSGARHDRVSIKDDVFFAMPVKLPSINEQEKIVKLLLKIEEKIQKQQLLVETLKKYKRGLLKDVFEQKISLCNYSATWGKSTLGEICSIIMGQSPDSDTYNEVGIGLPLVQGNADMKNGITNPQRYTNKPTKICEKNSIILSVRAPVGSVGKANQRVCIGRGVCALNSNYNDFIFYLLQKNEGYWKHIEQGGTFTAISSDDISEMPICYPCEEEIKRISSFFLTLDNRIANADLILTKFVTLKSQLLLKLFI